MKYIIYIGVATIFGALSHWRIDVAPYLLGIGIMLIWGAWYFGKGKQIDG